jgi:hypothetical protein
MENSKVCQYEENKEEDYEISGSPVTPTSSSPQPCLQNQPPKPSLDDISLRLQILALTEQLELLESITKGDCTIGISNISNLRNPENSNSWEDRIYGLLFDSEIPFAWVLEIIPTEIENPSETNDIEIAYVYFINELTKNESKKRIERFIHAAYYNQVYIV